MKFLGVSGSQEAGGLMLNDIERMPLRDMPLYGVHHEGYRGSH